MNYVKRAAQSGVILALFTVASGCIVEPREDHYDRDHHRYYHEHEWHQCGERNEHCHD